MPIVPKIDSSYSTPLLYNGHDRLRGFGRKLVRRVWEVRADLDVVDVRRHPVPPLLVTQLVVSLAHIADVGSGYVGHSRSVLSAPPEAIRVPSGLNATLYTSGYVECAYGGFGEGCRKRYDFVPYMHLSDGWFTKDGNSYCSEH